MDPLETNHLQDDGNEPQELVRSEINTMHMTMFLLLGVAATCLADCQQDVHSRIAHSAALFSFFMSWVAMARDSLDMPFRGN